LGIGLLISCLPFSQAGWVHKGGEEGEEGVGFLLSINSSFSTTNYQLLTTNYQLLLAFYLLVAVMST
jgi:hypothetical protein